MQRLTSPNNTSAAALHRRTLQSTAKHNFKVPARTTTATTQQSAEALEQKRRRQASIEAIPRLDLKKAEKYCNLPDPYAYLRDSYVSEPDGEDNGPSAIVQTESSKQ